MNPTEIQDEDLVPPATSREHLSRFVFRVFPVLRSLLKNGASFSKQGQKKRLGLKRSTKEVQDDTKDIYIEGVDLVGGIGK